MNPEEVTEAEEAQPATEKAGQAIEADARAPAAEESGPQVEKKVAGEETGVPKGAGVQPSTPAASGALTTEVVQNGAASGADFSFDDKVSEYVMRQFEFYFSDSNLPKDKFFRTLVEEGPDSMVDISIISTFSKLRKCINHHHKIVLPYGNSLKIKDKVPENVVKAIAEALEGSKALRLSECRKRVGRMVDLPPEEYGRVRREINSRSVVVEPISSTVGVPALKKFFTNEVFGSAKVLSIRIGSSSKPVLQRRKPTLAAEGGVKKRLRRVLQGWAFLEFETTEVAKDFVERHHQKVEFDGVMVSLSLKEDFNAKKKEEHEEKLSKLAEAIPPERRGTLARLVFNLEEGEKVPELSPKDVEKAFQDLSEREFAKYKEFVLRIVSKSREEMAGRQKAYFLMLRDRNETFVNYFSEVKKLKVRTEGQDYEATLKFVSAAKDDLSETEKDFWAHQSIFEENKKKRKLEAFSHGVINEEGGYIKPRIRFTFRGGFGGQRGGLLRREGW